MFIAHSEIITNCVLTFSSLAQAKTGTGKTLAFLVPVLQRIINNDPNLAQRSNGQLLAHSHDIRAIIISPTRELAEQIAVEAKKVASSTGVVIQTAVGGTRKQEGLARIRREGCHILVATPGRLKDILSDYNSRVSAPNLDVLVLDEADRLLDDGFGPEIDAIKELLPDSRTRDRQTLMFSATVPREVMGMVRKSMKPNFQFIKTVGEDEVPTHLRVPQKMVFIRGFENGPPAIIEILKKYIQRTQAEPNLRPMKAIIYYNTTVEVQLAYEALDQMRNDPMDRRSGNPLGRNIFRMHSKLTQSQRTNFSENFRRSKSAILISSDVTARGLDFPDVTHVIQVGVPRNRESYVHRLGRTGRAGKEGEGWILIHDEEEKSFIDTLGDLPVEQDRSIETADANLAKPSQELSELSKETIDQVTAAFKLVPYESKEDAYRVQLGVHGSVFRRKSNLVAAMNAMATNGWGLPEPPTVPSGLASKLGFTRVPGLKIAEDRRSRGSYGSGYGGGYGADSGMESRSEPRSESRFRRPQRREERGSGRFDADRLRGRRF